MKKATANTTKKNETKKANTTAKKATEKKEVKSTAKKATYEEMLSIMIALDSNAHERIDNNGNRAVQLFEGGKPSTRCELWARSAQRYVLYVGNETEIYKKAVTIAHKTYVDDKKMSKKELMLEFKTIEDVKAFVNQFKTTATKKATKTTKKEEKSA